MLENLRMFVGARAGAGSRARVRSGAGTYQNVSKRAKAYHNEPKRTKTYQNVPTRTKTCQSRSKRIKACQCVIFKIPSLPSRTKTYENFAPACLRIVSGLCPNAYPLAAAGWRSCLGVALEEIGIDRFGTSGGGSQEMNVSISSKPGGAGVRCKCTIFALCSFHNQLWF